MSRLRLFAAALVATVGTPLMAESQLTIETVHDSEAERATRTRLIELLREYDVAEWIYTTDVIIDQTQIPHSHPVLTLHTRHLGDDEHLMSTFVHEQFHWLEEGETLPAFRAAMRAFQALFPEAPAREGGGARDQESTYRHLIVCDLEFQAMTRLIGEEAARALMASITHYEWIYERVLTDPRIREVNERHGFVLDALPR
ncbi:MAG: hypothetical protein AAF389_05705 [Gemmatimonadota bacterium]